MTLLLRSIGDILSLFYLWPSIAVRSLFFVVVVLFLVDVYLQIGMEIFHILIYYNHQAFSNLKNK